MNRYYVQAAVAVLAVALFTLHASEVLAQSTVNLDKGERVATGIVTWLRGNLATAVFTAAFCLAGFLAAFNRISWMWVLMIFVGGFLVFGGSTLVTQIKSAFT